MLSTLENSLQPEEFEEVASTRESQAEYEYEPSGFNATHALEQDCPECERRGRLFGDVDVEHEVDYDFEQLPDGDVIPTLISSHYVITFIPKALACNVCKLELMDREELEACRVDTHPKQIEESDLGYDFDAASYAQEQYGDLG